MFAEDLLVFFSRSDFANEVVIFLPTGPRIISALFDNTYLDTAAGEVVMDATAPRLTCALSDALMPDGTDIPRGTKVTVRDLPENLTTGADFTVLKVLPEGTGTATIFLTQ